MITTSRFRGDTVKQNASAGCKMQFQQSSEIEVPPAGGDGGPYEDTSSCYDRSGFGDGVFGESERGTDFPADADIKARAAADSGDTFSGTER